MIDNTDILVTGDVIIDNIELITVPRGDSSTANWKAYPVVTRVRQKGGAFLLAEMIQEATGATVIKPELLTDVNSVSSDQIICTDFEIEQTGSKTYHISKYKGYSGPDSSTPKCLKRNNKVVKYPAKAKKIGIVVIDDAGNGFRDSKRLTKNAIYENAIIVHKMHHPLGKGELWSKLKKVDSNKLVVVVNANDIRKIKEVNISRSLSWERTAKEFVWQIYNNSALKSLKECNHLVVLFGSDGAIIHRGNELNHETLIFDPNNLEGQFATTCSGAMPGIMSAFVAALTAELHKDNMGGLENGVHRGLRTIHKLQSKGFQNISKVIKYPISKLFDPLDKKTRFVDIAIPFPEQQTSADHDFWRILDQKTQNTRQKVATDIVRYGLDKGLPDVPLGVFGKFKTVDRTEIESYSGIKNIINEFLNDPNPARPLSIAVFGSPGSGKSFGVTEVAKSICPGTLEKMVFNVSQFQGVQDLISAFHRVRNVVLTGKVPFVFFDEFDSSMNGNFGWLKYFLAPMQDGYFKEGETNHPLGKAIFVFAGGTSHSFEDFTGEGNDDGDNNSHNFVSAKGPDFVSRLRGFINILGTNPVGEKDDTCIIRRAIILRIMLELSEKTNKLFNSSKKLNIDEGVLRAFLNIPCYKHGTRSMGAIIDMGSLSGSKQYNQASLPPEHQMNLHVDSNTFLFLANKQRFLDCPDSEHEIIEKISAKNVQNAPKGRGKTRCNSYAFIADIPAKLAVIDCGVRAINENRSPLTPDITDEEIETLAKHEYERCCREECPQNLIPKTPDDYQKLSKGKKQYYRKLIEEIPILLYSCNFEIFRIQEFDKINDEQMIQTLAQLVHEDYCEKRIAEGDTIKSNSSICSFDSLDADIRDSSIDNARYIPIKLMAIGYRIRRLKDEHKPVFPKFMDYEIEKMAKTEHNRWHWQKRLQGWKYAASKKDDKKKTNPSMLPWDQLDDETKEYDFQTVRLIPNLLAKANFEIYRPVTCC
jgi:RyR domain